jgi:uncharacterized protein YceK
MRRVLLVAAVSALASGCVTAPPATPMEAYLNRYAGAEAVAMNCPAYGGYGSVAQMRSDAEKNLARAKSLGATAADVKKARDRINGQLMSAIFLIGPVEACNGFVNRLAWVGDSAPVIPPRKK